MAEKQNIQTKSSYNPVRGMDRVGYEALMAGGDTNKPLVTYDITGRSTIHYENMDTATPATLATTTDGRVTSVEHLEQMRNNTEQILNDANAIYSTIAPSFQQSYSRNALALQALNAPLDVYIQAGKSFGSSVLNVAHGILAQKHNLQEAKWNSFIRQYGDNNLDKINAFEAIDAFEKAAGKDYLPYMKVDALRTADGKELSEEAKNIVYQYKDLLKARKENTERMKVEQLFEEQDYEGFAEGLRLGEKRGGDKGSVIGMISNLTGDVAGSLAFYYTVGKATGGVQAASSKIAANLGTKLAPKIMAMSTITGEGAVFGASFLNQYNSIRTQALLNGFDLDKANAVAYTAGVVEGGLEFAGFSVFKRLTAKDGFIRNVILRDMLPESLQETAQTIGENVITEMFGLTDKDFGDILAEVGMAAVGGALGGGVFATNIRSRAARAAAWTERIVMDEIKALNGFKKEDIKKGFKIAQARIQRDIEEGKSQVKEVEQPENIETTEQQIQEDSFTGDEQTQKTLENQSNQAVEEISETNPTQVSSNAEKAAEIIYMSFGDMYRVYTEKAKARNPKMTDEQLANGWKAVTTLARLEYEGGVISKELDSAIDRALTFVNRENEIIKQNADKIKELMQDKRITPELAEQLSSKDWQTKHASQWQLAEQEIAELFERNGFKKEEGQIAAKFLKGMLYETTFLNPQITVGDLLKQMNLQIFNLQIAHFNNQAVNDTDLFSNIGDDFRQRNLSAEESRNQAEQIKEWFKNAEENATEINKAFFGKSGVDEGAKRTKAWIDFLATTEKKILAYSPYNINRDLGNDDYTVMTIMRARGASQEDINLSYGFTQNLEEAPSATYERIKKELYPPLSDEQAKSLNNLLLNMDVEASERKLTNVKGIYVPQTKGNTILITDGATGAVLHEFGHFSITKFLFDGLKMHEFGLLPKNSHLNKTISYFIEAMKANGRTITPAQLQETMLDALNRLVSNGQTGDTTLDALFNELNRENNNNLENIAGSIYGSKETTEEQKQAIESGVLGMLQNKNMANLLEESSALEEAATLNANEQNVDKDLALNQIKNFLDNNIIQNSQNYRAAAELAYANNDLFGLYSVMFDVAQQAKSTAYAGLIASATNEKEDLLKEFKGDMLSFLDDAYFMAEDGKPRKARQYKTLVEHAKEFDFKETAKQVYKAGHDLIQTLQSAAEDVSPELGFILQQGFYENSKRILDIKDRIGVISQGIDKATNITQEEFVRDFWHPLANAEKNSYEKSIVFIEKKLGKQAAITWKGLLDELSTIKTELQAKGVNGDLFKVENYFPLAVDKYDKLVTHYFKSPNVYSGVAKIVNRAIKDAETKKGKKLTDEEYNKLKKDIIDKINGQYQVNDDANQVTHFLRRTLMTKDAAILEYYKDPLDTLSDYFESAYRTIMMRNFIGRVQYDANGNPIYGNTGTIGSFLFNYAQTEEGLNAREAIDNFDKKMRYLAKRQRTDKNIFDTFRKVNQLTTLGSPINAINQIADLIPATTLFGTMNVVGAVQEVLSGKGVKVREVNAQSSTEAFRPQGQDTLTKATKKVYSMTGFKKMDLAVKDTILTAAKKWFGEALSGKDAQKMKEALWYIDQTFPDADFMVREASVGNFAGAQQERQTRKEKLLQDLKTGNMESDDVKFMLFSMLTRLQPLNASQVPALFNAMGPIGKLCYQFSTPAIRQLEFLKDYFIMKYHTGGGREAAKGLAKLLLFCVLIGVPKDMLANALRGQKTDLFKSTALSPMHVLMINEYTLSIAKKEGLFSAAKEMAAPSFGLADNVTKDIYRTLTFKDYKGHTFKSVPVFGQFIYWWMFGGKDYNEKVKQDLFDISEFVDNADFARKQLMEF